MDAAVQIKTIVNNTSVLPKGPLWSDVIGACARMYRQYSLILHLYLMVNLDPELHTTHIYISASPHPGVLGRNDIGVLPSSKSVRVQPGIHEHNIHMRTVPR